jgi:hypothetical protein
MVLSDSSKPSPHYQLVYAPSPYEIQGKSVFLSGSIDQGTAPWQASIANLLSHLPITILNPHRPDWDETWKQDISDARFLKQVTWELDGMDAVDVIAIYFGAEAKAPITLLELGLFARSGKAVVACPEGFWRRGNVQVICEKFGIQLTGSVEELSKAVEKKISDLEQK